MHLFVALATAVTYGWDEPLFRAINLVGTNALLDVFMVFFTTLGLTYILAILVVPLWWRGHKESAFDLVILLLIVMVITEAIKYAVGSPRPCNVLQDVHLLTPSSCAVESDPGFPSGHTSRAFAVAALLALRFRWRVGALAFVVAFLIGLSRIYLGVHWPSDVLGGAVLGLAMALVLWSVERRSPAYRSARTRVVAAIDRVIHRAKPS